jgi:hypothetical protein
MGNTRSAPGFSQDHFLTSVIHIEGLNTIKQLTWGSFGVVSLRELPPHKTVMAVKQQNIHWDNEAPGIATRHLTFFFRELFSSLYVVHPAVLPLFCWQVYPTENEARFYLVTRYMRNGPINLQILLIHRRSARSCSMGSPGGCAISIRFVYSTAT